MKSLRILLSCFVLILLAGGYLASQFFAFRHEAAEWSAKMDTAPVAWLALAILLGSIVLAFIPDRKENG